MEKNVLFDPYFSFFISNFLWIWIYMRDKHWLLLTFIDRNNHESKFNDHKYINHRFDALNQMLVTDIKNQNNYDKVYHEILE